MTFQDSFKGVSMKIEGHFEGDISGSKERTSKGISEKFKGCS